MEGVDIFCGDAVFMPFSVSGRFYAYGLHVSVAALAGFGGLGLSEPWLELVIAFARGVLNPGPGISLYDMIIIILILLS